MTTLHTPRLQDFTQEDRAILERIAKRMGRTPEALLDPSIMGVQAHWPAWLQANHAETNQAYRIQGKLPQIAKEAIHVAVSMTNRSQFLRVSCGYDDRSLVEATAMMMHSLSFNTVAHGMRLDAPMDDLAATDFGLGGRFEDTPGPGRPGTRA